ncbi:MAG: FAD-dependent oxidoreductase, partial [Pseudomonadota bacterium]
LRQQFSNAENIALSLRTLELLQAYAAAFNLEDRCGFRENGYLMLASDAGIKTLKANHAVQMQAGADIELLGTDDLSKRFTWLSTRGVAGGAFGRSGEGWFDPMLLLRAIRQALRTDEKIMMVNQPIEAIDVLGTSHRLRVSGNDTLDAQKLVIAAGASSGLASGLTDRNPVVPVEPRKRTIFVFESPARYPDMPLTVDPSGVYVRPEGIGYICGTSPKPEDDHHADPDDFEPDWHLFEDTIWPTLGARVPAFDQLRLKTAWAGHYDHNSFDENALIGAHDTDTGGTVYHLSGYSGHGVQQAPAAAESLAHMICKGHWGPVNCDAFSPRRLTKNSKLVERNII